jgi:hypothetical protein
MKNNRVRLKHIWETLITFHHPRHWWLLIGAYRTKRRTDCPPEIWRVVDPITGWLNSHEASLLHWAARSWPITGPVIELGSFAGRSTAALVLGGRFVYSVDAWQLSVEDLAKHDFARGQNGEDFYRQFLKNMETAGLADRIAVRRGTTDDIGRDWHEPGAILFIDANHSYVNVRSDLITWLPHLMPGGLLLMHDVISTDCPEVKVAVSEILRKDWRMIARAGSLVAFVHR